MLVVFFTGVFLAAGFLAAVFFLVVVVFLAAVFFAGAFLAVVLAVVFAVVLDFGSFAIISSHSSSVKSSATFPFGILKFFLPCFI